jgi:xylan 1,4-beta-xylosidase
MNRRITASTLALLFLFAEIACVHGAIKIAEENTIGIDADQVIGKIYNLWDVRVLNAPEKWLKKGYAEGIQSGSRHIRIINNVRALGGKTNRTCEWFKGVDAKGDPICDFTGLYKIIDEQLRVGFTPWIVLDNVPWGMVANPVTNFYGQCHPPDDSDLWYKYVRKCIRGLVARYGKEQVAKWRFRVGTEPNLFPKHWAGTKEQYFKHYDYTVAAVESVIPKPQIGPGNFLMAKGTQAKGKKSWTFEILDHCVNGKNYYTGKTGTRIFFYAQSCYAVQGRKFGYESNMQQFRRELAKYPSLKGLPHEIHEYGEIRSATQKGPAVGSIEWFAGLYAQTVDIAYRYGTKRIFNWGGLTGPSGRVVDCLVEMENGARLNVSKSQEKRLNFGAIAAWKGNTLYILAYSHDPKVYGDGANSISLTINGKRLQSSSSWLVSESLLDKHNGIVIHEKYKDIEAAGIKPKKDAFDLDPMFRKYHKEDQKKVREVLKANTRKYEKLSQMKQVRSSEKINIADGALKFKLQFKGSGVRFLKLTPTR